MTLSDGTTHEKKDNEYEKIFDVDAVIVAFCIVDRLYGDDSRDVMIIIRCI